MVITDLDGTLLNPDQKVSLIDYRCLLNLGNRGIVRVVATGRSPYSFSRVIRDDFPIDYLVFSSGSGIMNWKTGEILSTYSIASEKVSELAHIFKKENQSFKILDPAPNNHKYFFHTNGDSHPDFVKRMEFYRGFEKAIQFDPPNFGEASQILVILPNDVKEFDRLTSLCKEVKVIRATSPLDHQSIWMEIFHPDVSKGAACEHLCKLLDIDCEATMAIGNDYNDLDLLDFAGKSYVVANAPTEIKEKYTQVDSNDHDGFSQAVALSGVLG